MDNGKLSLGTSNFELTTPDNLALLEPSEKQLAFDYSSK